MSSILRRTRNSDEPMPRQQAAMTPMGARTSATNPQRFITIARPSMQQAQARILRSPQATSSQGAGTRTTIITQTPRMAAVRNPAHTNANPNSATALVSMRFPRSSGPLRPFTHSQTPPQPSSSSSSPAATIRTGLAPVSLLTNGATASPTSSSALAQAAAGRAKPRGALAGLIKCVYCEKPAPAQQPAGIGSASGGGVPLMLPCLHVVCSQTCLDKWCPNEKASTGTCPHCKTVFNLNAVEPHAFLVGKVTLAKCPQIRPQCEICTLQNFAVSFCIQCDRMECRACTNEHLDELQSQSQPHRIVTVESGMRIREQRRGIRINPSPEVSQCALHESPLTHHCSSCFATLCVQCSKRHEGHPVKTIQELGQERRATLDGVIKDFTEQLELAMECRKELVNRIPKLMNEEKIQLVKQAKQRLVFWMNVLLKEEVETRKQIAKATLLKAKELNMKRGVMEGFIEQTKQLLTLAKNIKESGDPVLVRCNKGAMDRQIDHLREMARSWTIGDGFNKWTERGMQLELHPIDRNSIERIATLTRNQFTVHYNKVKLELPPPKLKRKLPITGKAPVRVLSASISKQMIEPPPRKIRKDLAPAPENVNVEERKDPRPSAMVTPTLHIHSPDASPTQNKQPLKEVVKSLRETTEELKPATKSTDSNTSPHQSKKKLTSPVIDLVETESSTDEETPVIAIVQMKALMEKSDEGKSGRDKARSSKIEERGTCTASDLISIKDSVEGISNTTEKVSKGKYVAATSAPVAAASKRIKIISVSIGEVESSKEQAIEKTLAAKEVGVSQHVEGTAGEDAAKISNEPPQPASPQVEEQVDVERKVVVEPEPSVTPRREGLRRSARRVTIGGGSSSTISTEPAQKQPKGPTEVPNPTVAAAEPKKSERITKKFETEPSPEKKRTPLVVPPSTRVLRRESKSDSSTSSNAGEKETKYLRSSVSHKDGLKMKISLNVVRDKPKSNPATATATATPQTPVPTTPKAPSSKAVNLPKVVNPPKAVNPTNVVAVESSLPTPPDPSSAHKTASPTPTPLKSAPKRPPAPEATATTPSPSKRRRNRCPFASARRKRLHRPPVAVVSTPLAATTVQAQDVKPPALIPQAAPTTPASSTSMSTPVAQAPVPLPRPTPEYSRNRCRSQSRRKSTRVPPAGMPGVDDGQMKISDDPNDRNEDYCAVCRDGGNDVLICCDACPKVFHTHCHLPMVSGIPEDNWQCNICKSKEQLMEEWSSVPNLDTARCDESTTVKCGNRKVDVYKIQSCGLTKKDFIKACKLLCAIYQCENSKALSVHFERYLLQNNAISADEALHLNAIRSRLTKGAPTAINQIEDLVALLRKMFEQAKVLYKDVEYYRKVVQELEIKFNEILPDYFPNIEAAKSSH